MPDFDIEAGLLAVKNYDGEKEQTMRQAMQAASQTTPDAQAEVMGLSRGTGLSPDLVARNVPEVKQAVVQNSVDYGAMLRDNPKLAEYLGVRDNAALHRDEIPDLKSMDDTVQDHGALSGSWNTAKGVFNTLESGMSHLVTGIGAIPAWMTAAQEAKLPEYTTEGGISDQQIIGFDEQVKADALFARSQRRAIALDNPIYKAGKAGQEYFTDENVAADQAKSIADSWATDKTLALRKASYFMAGVAPYLLVGAIPGGSAAMATSAGGEATQSAIEAGVEPGTAAMAGAAKGVIFETAAKAGFLNPLAKLHASMVASLGAKVGTQATKEMLATVLTQYASHMVEGGIGLGTMELANAAVDVASGENPQGLSHPISTFAEGFASGAAIGAMTGLHPAVKFVQQRKAQIHAQNIINISEATVSADTLAKFGEQYLKMKESEKLPGATQAYAEHVLEGSDARNVIIKTEAFDKLYQDPLDIVQKLGIAPAYEEAKSNGFLKIPTHLFAEKFAGTPEFEKIKDDFRFENQEYTVNEAKENSKRATEEVAAAHEAAGKLSEWNAKYEAEFAEQVQKLGESAPLIGSSELYAQKVAFVHTKILENIAALDNKTAEQVMKLMPLELQSEHALAIEPIISPISGDALEQGPNQGRRGSDKGLDISIEGATVDPGERRTKVQDAVDFASKALGFGDRRAERAERRAAEEHQRRQVVRTPGSQINYEVAPNPDDAARMEVWKGLPEADRTRISSEVTQEILAPELKRLGLKGRFSTGIGGYEGDVNTSFRLDLSGETSPEDVLALSKYMGRALRQKSMMVTLPEARAEVPKRDVLYVSTEGKTPKEIFDKAYSFAPLGFKPLDGFSLSPDGKTMAFALDPEAMIKNKLTVDDVATNLYRILESSRKRKEQEHRVVIADANIGFVPTSEVENANSGSKGQEIGTTNLAIGAIDFDLLQAKIDGAVGAKVSAIDRARKGGGGETLYQSRDVTGQFYSTLEALINEKMSASDPASKLYSIITNKKTGKPEVAGILAGAKAEEYEVSGLLDFLKTKEKFTKAEVLAYIAANKVALTEHVYGGEIGYDTEQAIELAQEKIEKRLDEKMMNFDFPASVIESYDYPGKWEAAVRDSRESLHDTEAEAQDAVDEINSRYEQDFREEFTNEYWDRYYSAAKDELSENSEYVDPSYPKYREPGVVDETKYREMSVVIKLPESQARLDAKEKANLAYEKANLAQSERRDLVYEHPTGETSPDRPNGDRSQEIQDKVDSLRKQYMDYFDEYERLILLDNRRPFPSPHEFPDDTIFHYRVTDRTWPLETAKDLFPDLYAKALAEGKASLKIFFVEEFQSDLHQKAQEEGYNIPAAVPALKEKYHEAVANSKASLEVIRPILSTIDYMGFGSLNDALDHLAGKVGFEKANQVPPRFVEPIEEYKKVIKAELAAKKALDQVQGSVPDTPFKNTWVDMALKRAVRQAAEEGADAIFWANGTMNARRYPNEIRKVIDSLEWSGRFPKDSTEQGATLNKTVQGYKGNSLRIFFEVRPDGIIISDNEKFDGKHLREMVGGEMAKTILADDSSGRIEGENFVVGGTGMRKHYDEIIPSTAKKLFGKYGVKVERVPMGGVEPEAAHVDHEKAIVKETGDGVYTVYKKSLDGLHELPVLHTRDWDEAHRHADRINEVSGREAALFGFEDDAKAFAKENKGKVVKQEVTPNTMHQMWGVFSKTNKEIMFKTLPTPQADIAISYEPSRANEYHAYTKDSHGVTVSLESKTFRQLMENVDRNKDLTGREFAEFPTEDDATAWANENLKFGDWSIQQTNSGYEVFDANKPGYQPYTMVEPHPIPPPEHEMVMGFELTPALKEVAIRKGFPMFQGKELTPRGQITSDGLKHVITLFNNSDKSSPIHEQAHYFMDVIGFLHGGEGAAQGIKDLGDKILANYGVKSFADLNKGHKENFAGGMETYMMKGEAPNEEMRNVFAHFKVWFLEIYKNVRNMVTLTPELKDIYDTMLTGQNAAERAEVAQGLEPMFKDTKSSGMTEKQFSAYQKAVAEARQATDEKLTSRIMKKFQATEKKKFNDQRKLVESQVKVTTNEIPVYKAMSQLEGNQTPDTPLKINRADVPLEMVDKIPASMMSEKDGMHPNVISEILGYESGDKLLSDISEAMPKDEFVKKTTDERMASEHPDLIQGGKLNSEALAAIHNDKHAYKLRLELEHLAQHNMPVLKSGIRKITKRILPDKELKAKATDLIATKSISEIDPKIYDKMGRDQAAASGKLFAQGDLDGAFEAKDKERFNHALSMAATDAKESVAKSLEYMKKFNDPKYRKNIDLEYREQIDSLLDRYDLRKNLTVKAKAKSLASFVEELAASGYDPQVADKFLNEIERVHYKDMPFGEFDALSESIKSINEVGRLQKTVKDLLKNRDLKEVVAEAVLQTQLLPQRDPETDRGLNRMDLAMLKLKSSGRSLTSSLLKMEQMFDWLDDRNSGGAFNRIVFRRIADAGVKEANMRTAIGEILKKLTSDNIEGLTKDGGKIYEAKNLIDSATGKPQRLTKKELLALAGNMGNQSNADKLTRGEGWKEADVWEFLNENMNKNDWDFVAGMGKALESLWPEKLAMSRRLGNSNPDKIEPRKFQTPHGEYPGWYWPMVYDPARSQDVAERGAKNADAMFENIYARANTDTGRMNTRLQKYARPILLSLDVVPRVITEEIHDIAYHEAIVDADKFLSHPDIRQAVINTLSLEHYNQIRPWLQSIANDRKTDMKALQWFDKLAHGARTRATMVGLGYRLTTMVVHGSSAAIESVSEVGPVWMAKGVNDFSNPTKWSENAKFIFDRSGEMRNRMNEVDRDVRESLKEVDLKLMDPTSSAITRGLNIFRAHAYQGIAALDMASALPTWMAAYHKAMAPASEGGLGMGEADAIYAADKSVRNAHGGTGAKDMAAVQRGPEFFKLFTMFYSFWNHNVNRLMDTGRLASDKRTWQDSSKAATVIMRFFAYTLGIQAMHSMIHPKKNDDETSWAHWAAEEFAAATFAGIPIARDLAAHFLTGRDYSVTPAAQAVNTFDRVGNDAAAVLTGEKVSKKWLQNSVATLGYVVNAPLGQIGTTAQYLWDVADGEKHPETVSDWWHGILHGGK